MWAQYADDHSGVCFVLDHQLLHASVTAVVGVKGLYCGPVKYWSSTWAPEPAAYQISYLEDIFQKGMDGALESHIHAHSDALFFSKHLDWRDEWEYRWVFRSDNLEPIYIPIEKCIKGIVVGEDCLPDRAMEISRLCQQKNIPLFRLHQHGWTLSALPADATEENIISLDGVNFSTLIPTAGVFVQVRDHKGKNRTLRIDNNGDVVLLA